MPKLTGSLHRAVLAAVAFLAPSGAASAQTPADIREMHVERYHAVKGENPTYTSGWDDTNLQGVLILLNDISRGIDELKPWFVNVCAREIESHFTQGGETSEPMSIGMLRRYSEHSLPSVGPVTADNIREKIPELAWKLDQLRVLELHESTGEVLASVVANSISWEMSAVIDFTATPPFPWAPNEGNVFSSTPNLYPSSLNAGTRRILNQAVGSGGVNAALDEVVSQGVSGDWSYYYELSPEGTYSASSGTMNGSISAGRGLAGFTVTTGALGAKVYHIISRGPTLLDPGSTFAGSGSGAADVSGYFVVNRADLGASTSLTWELPEGATPEVDRARGLPDFGQQQFIWEENLESGVASRAEAEVDEIWWDISMPTNDLPTRGPSVPASFDAAWVPYQAAYGSGGKPLAGYSPWFDFPLAGLAEAWTGGLQHSFEAAYPEPSETTGGVIYEGVHRLLVAPAFQWTLGGTAGFPGVADTDYLGIAARVQPGRYSVSPGPDAVVVGLGTGLHDLNAQGALVLHRRHDFQFGPALGHWASLRFEGVSDAFELVYDSSPGEFPAPESFAQQSPWTDEPGEDDGWRDNYEAYLDWWFTPRLRQVMGRQILADIVYQTDEQFTVDLYWATGGGFSKDGEGFYDTASEASRLVDSITVTKTGDRYSVGARCTVTSRGQSHQIRRESVLEFEETTMLPFQDFDVAGPYESEWEASTNTADGEILNGWAESFAGGTASSVRVELATSIVGSAQSNSAFEVLAEPEYSLYSGRPLLSLRQSVPAGSWDWNATWDVSTERLSQTVQTDNVAGTPTVTTSYHPGGWGGWSSIEVGESTDPKRRVYQRDLSSAGAGLIRTESFLGSSKLGVQEAQWNAGCSELNATTFGQVSSTGVASEGITTQLTWGTTGHGAGRVVKVVYPDASSEVMTYQFTASSEGNPPRLDAEIVHKTPADSPSGFKTELAWNRFGAVVTEKSFGPDNVLLSQRRAESAGGSETSLLTPWGTVSGYHLGAGLWEGTSYPEGASAALPGYLPTGRTESGGRGYAFLTADPVFGVTDWSTSGAIGGVEYNVGSGMTAAFKVRKHESGILVDNASIERGWDAHGRPHGVLVNGKIGDQGYEVGTEIAYPGTGGDPISVTRTVPGIPNTNITHTADPDGLSVTVGGDAVVGSASAVSAESVNGERMLRHRSQIGGVDAYHDVFTDAAGRVRLSVVTPPGGSASYAESFEYHVGTSNLRKAVSPGSPDMIHNNPSYSGNKVTYVSGYDLNGNGTLNNWDHKLTTVVTYAGSGGGNIKVSRRWNGEPGDNADGSTASGNVTAETVTTFYQDGQPYKVVRDLGAGEPQQAEIDLSTKEITLNGADSHGTAELSQDWHVTNLEGSQGAAADAAVSVDLGRTIGGGVRTIDVALGDKDTGGGGTLIVDLNRTHAGDGSQHLTGSVGGRSFALASGYDVMNGSRVVNKMADGAVIDFTTSPDGTALSRTGSGVLELQVASSILETGVETDFRMAGDGHVTKFTTTSSGKSKIYPDATASVTQFDSAGRAGSVTLPSGGVIAITYDQGTGLAEKITYPDPFGELPGDSLNIEFQRYKSGRVKETVDDSAGERDTTYSRGRIASEDHTGTGLGAFTLKHDYGTAGDAAAPVSLTLQFTGDQSATDTTKPNRASRRVTWTRAGTRITAVTLRTGSGSNPVQALRASVSPVSYYDASGLVSGFTGSDVGTEGGFSQSRDYDSQWRLTKLDNGLAGHWGMLREGSFYTADGLRQEIWFEGDTNNRWHFDYDSEKRVTGADLAGSLPTSADLGYSYDARGNRTLYSVEGISFSATNDGGGLNQVTSVSREAGSYTISGSVGAGVTLLVNGNPVSVSPGGGGFVAECDTDFKGTAVSDSGGWYRWEVVGVIPGAGDGGVPAVAEESGWVFVRPSTDTITYNADGQRATDALWAYTWDGLGRLVQMESHDFGHESPRTRLSFVYDAEGRRVSKTVEERPVGFGAEFAATEKRLYVYDGWRLFYEEVRIPTGPNAYTISKNRTYIWGPDLDSSEAGLGGVGGLLCIVEGTPAGGTGKDAESNRVLWPLYDLRGNVIGTAHSTSGSKTLLARTEFGPFGEMVYTDGNWTEVNPMGFATHYTDHESGLVYFGLRYYDPDSGNWLSREPLGESVSPNLYRFRNPVNETDYVGANPVGLFGTRDMELLDELFDPFEYLIDMLAGGRTKLSASENTISWKPPSGGVGGIPGGAVRLATFRMVPVERYPSPGSAFGLEVGGSIVPILSPLQNIAFQETTTGIPVSVKGELAYLALDAFCMSPFLASSRPSFLAHRGELNSLRFIGSELESQGWRSSIGEAVEVYMYRNRTLVYAVEPEPISLRPMASRTGAGTLDRNYIFRGDKFYQGGDVGIPLNSSADITDFVAHVLKKESKNSSLWRSFTTDAKVAQYFAGGRTNSVLKIGVSDLRQLESRGIIKLFDATDVRNILNANGVRARDVNAVFDRMTKNGEILIEGAIPQNILKRFRK